MARKFYKRIEDVPARVVEAYRADKYSFNPDHAYHHNQWSEVDWINIAHFAPELEELMKW